MGIVVRDHLGRLIACRCIQYVGVSEPFVAELLACRDAILMAIEKGWSSILLETDCQLIVRDWIEGNDRSALARRSSPLVAGWCSFLPTPHDALLFTALPLENDTLFVFVFVIIIIVGCLVYSPL